MDLGRRVVVIGGGFVAFDAARTALRRARGAPRRHRGGAGRGDRRAAEGSPRLRARGAARRRHRGDDRLARELRRDARAPHDAGPRGVRGSREGRRALHHPARAPAASSATAACGRRAARRDQRLRRQRPLRPAYDDDDVMTLEADACVLAIGQQADLSFLKPADGVALTPGGTIRVDPATLATSAPGVFAGGDVAFGPRNLIEAVANGKRAAQLDPRVPRRRRRAARDDASTSRRCPTAHYRMIAGFELLDREAPPTLDLGPAHRHRRGRDRIRRRRGAAAGRALPRLPRADDLRPREVRALQPVRGRLPRVLPGDRPVRVARSRPEAKRRARRRAPRPTACRSPRW